MKTKTTQDKSSNPRKQYTPQFKEQALERAEKERIARTAQDLCLLEALLYAWRAKRRQSGQSFEEQKLQQAELARFKRENARLEEEVAFLKKRPRILPSRPSEVRDDPSSQVRRAFQSRKNITI